MFYIVSDDIALSTTMRPWKTPAGHNVPVRLTVFVDGAVEVDGPVGVPEPALGQLDVVPPGRRVAFLQGIK